MNSEAGWYPNRANAMTARYWNGVAWTGATRPIDTFRAQVNRRGNREVQFDRRLQELPAALRLPIIQGDSAKAPVAQTDNAGFDNSGWFPDQADVARERWFDGDKWTAATRAVEQQSMPVAREEHGDDDSHHETGEDAEALVYMADAHRRGTRTMGWVTIILLAVAIGSFAGVGPTATETWICTGRAIDCLSIQQTPLSSFLGGSAWIALVAAAVFGWKWVARKVSE